MTPFVQCLPQLRYNVISVNGNIALQATYIAAVRNIAIVASLFFKLIFSVQTKGTGKIMTAKSLKTLVNAEYEYKSCACSQYVDGWLTNMAFLRGIWECSLPLPTRVLPNYTIVANIGTR